MLREVLWKDMLNMKINKNFIEIELGKLYAVWLREFIVFLREKSRIIASTFTPLLWLFVLGAGFGTIATNPTAISGTGHIASGGGVGSGVDYQRFIFPGIVSMSIIFSSVFFGSYIIWDRKFDFLKSVMVAPVSRTTIFIGKTFGGMTTSLMQAAILLVVGLFLGIHYTPFSIVLIVVIILFPLKLNIPRVPKLPHGFPPYVLPSASAASSITGISYSRAIFITASIFAGIP